MTWTFEGTNRLGTFPGSAHPDVAMFQEGTRFRNFFPIGDPITMQKLGSFFSDMPRYGNPAAVGMTTIYDLFRDGAAVTPAPTPPTAGMGPWTYDGPALDVGSYMVRNQTTGTPDPFWKSDQGGTFFHVVRANGQMPNPPVGTWSAGKYAEDDAALYHKFLFGPVRQFGDISRAVNAPNDGNFDHGWNDSLQFYHNNWYKNFDTTRKKITFLLFTSNYPTTSAEADAIKAWVARYNYIDVISGPNEPGGTIGVDSGFIPVQRTLYQAVKAQNPTQQVGGLETENVAHDTNSLANLNDYLAAGGGQWFDVATVHGYPAMGMGDSIRDEIDYWQRWNAVLAAHGQHMKPKLNTEGGTMEGNPSGIAYPMLQASTMITTVLGWEQVGLAIPGSSDGAKEAFDYFYSREHGTWGFAPTSYFSANGSGYFGGVSPGGLLYYNHGYELIGCPFDGVNNVTRAIEFKDRAPFLGGHVYRRRPNGTGVAVMKSSGPPIESVKLLLRGTDIPATVTHVTGFGKEITLNVETEGSDKFVTMELSRVPQHYLRLTAGMDDDFEVVEPGWRARKIVPVGISFNGNSKGTKSLTSVIKGPFLNSLKDNRDNSSSQGANPAAGIEGSMWTAADELGTGTGNDTFTINLGTACIVNHVQLSAAMMFNGDSALLRAHLLFETSPGVWERLGDEVDEVVRAQALDHVSNVELFAARQTLLWDHPRFFPLEVPNVTATRLRVKVEQTTIGGTFDQNGITGYGINPTYYASVGGWKGGPAAYQGQVQKVSMQKVVVYGTRAGRRVIIRPFSPPAI